MSILTVVLNNRIFFFQNENIKSNRLCSFDLYIEMIYKTKAKHFLVHTKCKSSCSVRGKLKVAVNSHLTVICNYGLVFISLVLQFAITI